MAMPRHPTPGMPPFYGEHPPAYNPMMQPPQVEKPLGPMPPQMHVPQVRFEDFFFFARLGKSLIITEHLSYLQLA